MTADFLIHNADLVATCADGGVLRIIECDLDGDPLDAAAFAALFGHEPVPLGDTK